MYRSFLEWEWFDDADCVKMLIYFLLKANHQDKKVGGVTIHRGEFMTSYRMLEKELKMGNTKIRTNLRRFERSKIIDTVPTHKFTLIRILNYDTYQKNQHVANTWSTRDRYTNNNVNNVNNVNNMCVVAPHTTHTPYENPKFNEFWGYYPKKGYRQDTLKFWCEQNYTDEEIEKIVTGTRILSYKTISEEDLKHFPYPRRFLEDRLYLDYYNKHIENKETLADWGY